MRPTRPIGERFVVAALSLITTSFVLATSLGHGVPALRHDWRLPGDSAALGSSLLGFTSGWVESGIGELQPYPTFYLPAGVLWIMHFVLPPVGVIGLLVGASTAIAVVATFAFARARGTSIVAAAALGVIAACNPWTYSKIVAGHIFMVFAYAIVIALIAECARAKPRTFALVLFSSLLILQLQFFLIAVVPFAVWCLRRRRALPFIAPFVASAPLVLGVAASYGQLRATPYLLGWERQMSVPPLSGLLLSGYTFNYAHEFAILAPLGVVVAAIAVVGSIRMRAADDRIVVGLAVASWLLAAGSYGWFAPAYEAAVVRFPETGVYRELYDLIAVIVVGYLVLLSAALAGRTSIVPTAFVCILGLSLVGVWAAHPPDAEYTPWTSFPHPTLPQDSATRVALTPAFQPLSIDGTTSGVDPDAFVRPRQAIPINEPLALFPVDVALAYFRKQGTTGRLGALGVAEIVRRPYLHAVRSAFDPETIAPTKDRLEDHADSSALPLAGTIGGQPPVVSIGNDPRAFGRFFGDDSRGVVPVTGSDPTTDFAQGWLDARLGFQARPQWGTRLGGIATASRHAIAIPRASALLAQTDDTIRDDRGRIVATRTIAPRWWPLRGDARELACTATCILVATSVSPVPAIENGPHAAIRPVTVVRFAPWLAQLTLPAHDGVETLRIAERYDPHWIVVPDIARGRHVRLAGELNGWIVDASAHDERLFVVEWIAAVQLLMELVAIGFLIGVAIATRPRNRYPSSR
jgi:hypothetical protein